MLTAQQIRKYFTGFEQQIEFFREVVQSSQVSRKMIIVYGIGGIGKSSLLKMYEIECEYLSIPCALVSGNEHRSVIDILVSWEHQLGIQGVKFTNFRKGYRKYRLTQAKADETQREAMGKISDTAQTLVETAINLVPGGGVIASAAGSAGIGVLTDLFNNRYSESDLDLMLNPSQALSQLFLDDISKVSVDKRIVFFVDTFEQLPILKQWFRDFVQQLRENCLVVISGRKMPFDNQDWPGWLSDAHIQELTPLPDSDIERLITRYYSVICDTQPGFEQIKSITQFSRGLPLAATTAVQLLLERGVSDFQSIKEEVTADLVDKLFEGTSPKFINALEVSAVFRTFNREKLRSVIIEMNLEETYDKLRRLSFVYPVSGGFSLHDSVREIILDYLKNQDNHRYQELHQKAAEFFVEKDDNLYLSEVLYHQLCINEDSGIKLFYQLFYASLRSSQIELCENLLNEASAFSVQMSDSYGWIHYCEGLMSFVRNDISTATGIWNKIGDNEFLKMDLRATAEHGLGVLYFRLGELERSLTHFERAKRIKELLDDKRSLALTLSELSKIYRSKSEWVKTIELYRKTAMFLKELGEDEEYAEAILQMSIAYRLQGYWRKSEKLSNLALQVFRFKRNDHGISRAVFNLGWLDMLRGELQLAIERFDLCLNIAQSNNAHHIVAVVLIGKGNTMRMLKNWELAEKCLSRSLHIYTDMKYKVNIGIVKGNIGELLYDQGEFKEAETYYRDAINIFRDSGNRGNLCIVFERLSRLLMKKYDLDMSIEFSERTIALSKELNYLYVNCLARLNLLQARLLKTPSIRFSREFEVDKLELIKTSYKLGYYRLENDIINL